MIEQKKNPKKHLGSCHCGAVQFEAFIDAAHGTRCNCTNCQKLGVTTSIIKPDAFTLLQGEESLTFYSRFPEVAGRYFCKRCGIHCFSKGSLPQLGGAFVSVSLNALVEHDINTTEVLHWDGRHNNWEAGPRRRPWPVFSVADVDDAKRAS